MVKVEQSSGEGGGVPHSSDLVGPDQWQSQLSLQPRHWSSVHEWLLEQPAPAVWHACWEPHPKLTLLVGLPPLKCPHRLSLPEQTPSGWHAGTGGGGNDIADGGDGDGEAEGGRGEGRATHFFFFQRHDSRC